MREEKPLERKVTLRNDRLQKYFPPSYTPKQMEEVIVKLLEGWHRKRQQEQALLQVRERQQVPEQLQQAQLRERRKSPPLRIHCKLYRSR